MSEESKKEVHVQSQELFFVELILENGYKRQLVDNDETGNKFRLKLTTEQIVALEEAIKNHDIDFVQQTGLDDIAADWGPQLALTEQSGKRFWITGDKTMTKGWLKVIEIQFIKASE